MPTLPLELPHHRYEIVIEPGALEGLGPGVRAVAPHGRAGLFMDAAVETTAGRRAAASLEAAGYQLARHVLEPGEAHKTLTTVARLYDTALEARLERASPFVAVGGGVVGDTVGFAAASWLRGVPFIQCPTTLLAMVDASVGGKTGVNLPAGKNLVGAFHQPHRVVIDVTVLQTLPDRERRSGLAECVKHAMIRSPALFDWIESHADAIEALDPEAMTELIERNVAIKAAVVTEDERERGVRAHLNFGHTFAHAIEATCGYGHYRHGEAVALGMVAATRLAVDAGRMESATLDRLRRLLQRLGLPDRARALAPTATLIETMKRDKKVTGDRLRLVLPTRLGEVTLDDQVPEAQVAAAWEAIREKR